MWAPGANAGPLPVCVCGGAPRAAISEAMPLFSSSGPEKKAEKAPFPSRPEKKRARGAAAAPAEKEAGALRWWRRTAKPALKAGARMAGDGARAVKQKAQAWAKNPAARRNTAAVAGSLVAVKLVSSVVRAPFAKKKRNTKAARRLITDAALVERVPPADVAAACFDLDGTLVNSLPFTWRTWQLALRKTGLAMTEAEFYAKAGLTARAVFTALAKQQNKELDFDKDVLPLLQRGYDIELTRGRPHPIAVVVRIAKMHKDRGHKIAVCSTAPRIHVYDALARCGFPRDFFDAVVSGEEARDAHAAYSLACKRMHADHDFTVAYDDTASGIDVASAMGLKVVDVTILKGYPRTKSGLNSCASPRSSPASHGVSYQIDEHEVDSPTISVTSTGASAMKGANGKAANGSASSKAANGSAAKPAAPGSPGSAKKYQLIESKVASAWKNATFGPASPRGSTASSSPYVARKLDGAFKSSSMFRPMSFF